MAERAVDYALIQVRFAALKPREQAQLIAEVEQSMIMDGVPAEEVRSAVRRICNRLHIDLADMKRKMD
jgi:hypothetical protein